MPVRVIPKRTAAARPTTAAAPTSALPFGLPMPSPERPQKPPGISLCMIVKNEERFLAQCLRSVADAVDEIIIVDTGSTDATIEIAKSFGAHVLERPWRNDFAWARNESIAPATKRWIFFLDADEELMPESKAMLRSLCDVPTQHHAVWVRCHNQSDDYSGTGAMSHALVRIFPNTPEIRFRGLIHEFPCIENAALGLEGVVSPIAILHHGYLREVVRSRNKGARNLEIVEAATERDPEDAYNWFNLGSTAFMVGDFERSRDAFEMMRTVNKDQPRGFIPNGLSVLSELYSDKFGDPQRGEAVLRECLRVAPRYANAHFQLGKCLIAQQRFAEAREAFEAAIADGAYAHLQFVVDDQVYVWKAHSEIGSTYVLEGDDERAVEWFRKGLHNAPNVHPLQGNLARALERLKRFDEAEQIYRQAFTEHGGDAAAVDLVNFLLRREKGVAALEVIEAAHARVSDEVAATILLVGAQLAQRNGLPPLRFLEAAAQRDPGSALVMNPLETLLRARGDEAALAELLSREAAVPPRRAADFLRRSHQAMAAGNPVRARELAQSGIALEPANGYLRYNAALAALRLGEREAAIDEARKVEPAQADVYVAARLLLATAACDSEDFDGAVAALDALLAVDPRHVEALILRAKALESAGNGDAAEEALRRLVDVDGARGSIELAGFYLRHERFAEAAAVADRALQP